MSERFNFSRVAWMTAKGLGFLFFAWLVFVLVVLTAETREATKLNYRQMVDTRKTSEETLREVRELKDLLKKE